MTVNKRHILHAAWLRLTLCVAALAVLCVLVSCSDDSDDDGSRTVVLRFSTAQTTGVTRAATASTAKDDAVKDLTVLIFDSNGDVIGSKYESYDYTQTNITVSIQTRVAKGCTVYAFANVGTLIDPNYFHGLSKKSAIDSKVYKMTKDGELDTQTWLLMKGELDNFDTSASSGKTIGLQRLASKFEITIEAQNDPTDGSWPITIDKYQLCKIPGTTTLSKLTDQPVPSDYYNGSETPVNLTSAANSPVSKKIVTYMYGNNVGSNANATDWTKRNSNNQPTKQNGASTFLHIWAHTAVWKSEFYVYLGGKTLTADGTSPAYDYTDYTIYPNYHYTVNITIKGSGHAENGARVSYQAIPYFSVASINAWGTAKTTSIDM
ncbi:fimbrial protein [Hallella absiana]|uniref:fimbrial protein n=1 Tax=Hallella absiana TaxID=2925336 RepID=UPI0021C5F5A5|nr:fimbrial protein [Hallella absiana]